MSDERSDNDRSLSVLVLEPYYGGSHKSFLSGLQNLPFNFEFFTLPARNWKWRMRLAAPYFAHNLHENRKTFDRILCSSYVDTAAFRGLAPEWVKKVPLLTYFHENQFSYPVQVNDERDIHFGITNITTALASDSLAFNSLHNLTSFLEGTENLMKHSADLRLRNPVEIIQAKSRILPPGIDFSVIDSLTEHRRNSSPVIVWNHRWEHDKNPDLFFRTLFTLDKEEIDFNLVVLGQSFENSPSVFDEARKRLSHKILHFGYAETAQEYAGWLKKSDIAVSTALHEFFGIAVIEAVRAGCTPLLPDRLSYPELFPDTYLYGDSIFYERLKEVLRERKRISNSQIRILTDPYSWENLHKAYTEWIVNAQTYTG